MLENIALRDARPAIVVCPDCAKHLMDVKDVRWAMTKLEFIFECSGCGAELTKSIAGDTPVFTSLASKHLKTLEIFRFDPDAEKSPRHRAMGSTAIIPPAGARRTV